MDDELVVVCHPEMKNMHQHITYNPYIAFKVITSIYNWVVFHPLYKPTNWRPLITSLKLITSTHLTLGFWTSLPPSECVNLPGGRVYKVGPYDRYKWSYNPCKWPYKWVTGVITLLKEVITPFITGRGPPCRYMRYMCGIQKTHK